VESRQLSRFQRVRGPGWSCAAAKRLKVVLQSLIRKWTALKRSQSQDRGGPSVTHWQVYQRGMTEPSGHTRLLDQLWAGECDIDAAPKTAAQLGRGRRFARGTRAPSPAHLKTACCNMWERVLRGTALAVRRCRGLLTCTRTRATLFRVFVFGLEKIRTLIELIGSRLCNRALLARIRFTTAHNTLYNLDGANIETDSRIFMNTLQRQARSTEAEVVRR
jgi:hypothetical protein